MRFTNQNFKHVFCWLNLLERKRDQHMDKLLMMTFDVFGINWVFVLLSADDGTWWGEVLEFEHKKTSFPNFACFLRPAWNIHTARCVQIRKLGEVVFACRSVCWPWPCLIWLEGYWMIEAKFLTCLDRDIATNSMPEWCQLLCLLSFLLSLS